MPKYRITFAMLKEVDEWDDEDGASGNPRMVDESHQTIDSSSPLTLKDLQKFLSRSTDLEVKEFRCWPDEDGRFTTNRLEDNEGNASPRGKYLADYDVRVSCEIISPKKQKIGSLGLKSINE